MDTADHVSEVTRYADWSNDQIRAHIAALEELMRTRRVPVRERIRLITDPEVAEKVVAFCKKIRPTMTEMEENRTLGLSITINEFEHVLTISAAEAPALDAYMDELKVAKTEGEAEEEQGDTTQ